MVDTLSRAERSERMALVRYRDTKPELVVRKLVSAMGYRYRLHARKLPGTPDLVFVSRRKAIFVHGCFWHRHPGCPNTRMPKSRLDFWAPKLRGNRERDLKKLRKLRRLGWKVLVLWECQVGRGNGLSSRIAAFLEGEP